MNMSVPEESHSKYIKSLKRHWNPLMHKLGWYNIANLKDVKAQINKKISIMDSGLSVFQTNIFVNNFRFTLGEEYEAKCTTIMVEPDCFKILKRSKDKADQANIVSQVNYWVAVKGWFLKHYSEPIDDEDGNAVDTFDHFMLLQNHLIPKLKDELEAYQTNFENIFCLARSLHDMSTFVQLKNNIKNIKETQASLDKALREYQRIIEMDPLLNTYSKYICCMYRAMTVLCKLVDEPVYTWKMFLRIVESVVTKKKREQSKREREEAEEGETDNEKSNKHIEEYKERLGLVEKKQELSFDFLYSEILPSIYSVISAGYSPENVSLMNLLFSLEIGNQRGSFDRDELEFFLEALIKFKNYKDWRKPETAFVRITAKIDKSEYLRLKRNLIRLYPKHREIFDKIDDKVTTYKDIMNILFKDERDKQTLMEDINLRFL